MDSHDLPSCYRMTDPYDVSVEPALAERGVRRAVQWPCLDPACPRGDVGGVPVLPGRLITFENHDGNREHALWYGSGRVAEIRLLSRSTMPGRPFRRPGDAA